MHCLNYVYDGGQEYFLVKTFKYIQLSSQNKYEFIICSLVDSRNEELIKKYKESNIKFYSFNFSNRKKSKRDIFNNVNQLFKLSSFIKKQRVQILYGHDLFAGMVVRFAYLMTILFYFYKVKKVYISIHNIFFWWKGYHHIINKILSYFTDVIVCVSNSVFEYSLRTDKIKRDKYLVIPNGIDIKEFSFSTENRKRIRAEFNLSDEIMVIGAVGSISFRKGHKYLINAFKEVADRYPCSVLYIFGGTREIDQETEVNTEIYQLIKRLNLVDKVKICSPRIDIDRVFSMFDIYVMPSTVEGFGLSLVEAMAMERIVIASDIPPFREIIDDGFDGFLFRSKDYEDLKNKLLYVINLEPSTKQRIAKRARDKVIEKYNSNLMGKSYETLYDIKLSSSTPK